MCAQNTLRPRKSKKREERHWGRGARRGVKETICKNNGGKKRHGYRNCPPHDGVDTGLKKNGKGKGTGGEREKKGLVQRGGGMR